MAGSKRQLALWIASVNLCLLVTFSGIHGDVPDDVVYTELHKDVRIGGRAVLTCRFQGSPLAVYWKKGYDPRQSPNLVSWIPIDDVTGKCEGQRACEIMEMNENHSLIIKEVGFAERGRYICRVANYKGNIIHNFTDVSVHAPPKQPYPVIEGCTNNMSLVSNPDHCILTSNTITLTCSVTNYYPEIELFFLHGTKQMTTVHQEEQTNVDSTKNKSISIEAGPSETLYTCVASDVPGSRERKAASILVGSSISIPSETIPVTVETMKEGIPVTIAVIIVISNVLLGAASVVYIWHVWWKRRRRYTHNGGIEGVRLRATRLETQQTSIQRREGTLWINPARGKDFDDILITIADKVVSRKEIYDLGMALGFGPEDIDRYVEQNKRETGVSYMGTLSMLRRWRKNQTENTELEALQTAQEKADQIHLAAELFGE